MPEKKRNLTQKRLKEVLDYNPTTGIFTRKTKTAYNSHIGEIVGSFDSRGYWQITIDRERYKAHRLAWLYIKGYFPENEIDHLNGKKDDNRLSNLREVSRACNMQNSKKYSTNTSGFPGVDWNKQNKKWRARIRIHNKKYFLGIYDDPLDAALARLTEEVWNPNWHCNYRGELIKAIKKAWPDFNDKCLN